ncbi:MAG: hypothetical protein EZS28_033102 [Streblomastix strix]|uniref:B30.2/SPRY domain-containing protein n=1 Tax=Streblomastix strix TaxID=222440 RepID=A0A5J4UMW5_9EUKA|nr:MAG: hypothetical protein EZS28_033102 [Streblomastix strix]
MKEDIEKDKQYRENKEAELKQLKEVIENLQPKPPQDFPNAIHNPDPADIDFTDVDGRMKKISKKLEKYNIVSLTQVMEDGIWDFETEFSCPNSVNASIGIVQDSYPIPIGVNPWNQPQISHIAFFGGKGLSPNGGVWCKGTVITGNVEFKNNQKVKVEYDSEKGTLIFFIDGVQQPVYVTGINEKVRFFIHICHTGSSCTIRSLKKLTAATSGHVANEKAIQW